MGCLICGKDRIVGRGLCQSHYEGAKRRNEIGRYPTKAEAGTNKTDLGKRLMAKVEKDTVSGCWNWTGATSHGYGAIQMWPKVQRAHRVAYEYFVGPIPIGKLLRHICDNKRCVNPAHLLPGTKSDNGRDSVERGQFRPRNKLIAEQKKARVSEPLLSPVMF
jgi:hypothetical protein